MINYLEILRKNEREYFNLSLDELKTKLNHKNNQHSLINDIKNYIFKYNYIPTYNLIYNYMAQSHVPMDNDLVNEFVGGEKKRKINCLSFDFINFILEKIVKIKFIDRSDKNIDYSDISDDFNNFYNCNNMVESYKKVPECPNAEFENEDLLESSKEVELEKNVESYGYFTKKKVTCPRYFGDTKILVKSFSVPYKLKKITDFSFNEDLLKDLTLKKKLLLCQQVDKYCKKINYVKEHNFKDNNNNYLSYYKIKDGEVIHCFFEYKDDTTIRNAEIAYHVIKNNFFNNEKSLFDNREFFILQKKLEETIRDVNNKVFYIFDIHKAFYTTPFNNIKETCKILFEDQELYLHFLILWEYFENIKKGDYILNFLPITKYSGLIFKLYLKSILSAVTYDNYYVYVDDFIVYGTEESSEKTFDLIFKTLKNNDRQLSTFSIYDKAVHESMVFLNREYKFDRKHFIEDRELNIEISFETNHEGDYFNKTLIALFKNNFINDKTNNLNINFIQKEKEDDNICAICKDNKKDICLTCGHILCRSCFLGIEETNALFICPFCGLTSQSYTKVFL